MDADALLEPLVASPGRTALLFDVDGTLSPIAPAPDLAIVPEATRAELTRLAARYRLVACISGRSGDEAAALVGVPGVRTVGNHGLELSARRSELEQAVAAFRSAVDGRWPVEDKGLTLAFHYRTASDEEAAIELLRVVAREAEEAGLEARWGRKVLEVRPRADEDKGTAVLALIAESGTRLALYAGDDTTDLDAFRGLEDARLEARVRVAVTSAEADPRLAASADLEVDGPEGLLDVMRRL